MKVQVYIDDTSYPGYEHGKWNETDIATKSSDKPRQVAYEAGEAKIVEIGTVYYVSDINYLMGKLLTLADASFTDVDQRKAFKDLLNSSVWGHYDALRSTGPIPESMRKSYAV